MSEPEGRWPHAVYGVGAEPDPRFSFANERTFLAWIRTALAFIAAAVGVAALAQLTGEIGLLARVGSAVLAVCGLFAAAVCWIQWIRNERALRLGRPLPSSAMMPVLSVTLVAFAALAVAYATGGLQ